MINVLTSFSHPGTGGAILSQYTVCHYAASQWKETCTVGTALLVLATYIASDLREDLSHKSSSSSDRGNAKNVD